MNKTRTIVVDALARVEGEGALYVKATAGKVEEIKFRIFEPPRFFEAFLRGRIYSEAPDITARICGICPLAYIMGANQALENAFGVEIPQDIEDLRRLAYCGEWIESHVLHAAMLHAPDFLGLDDSLQIAKQNPELVTMALQLKKLGNSLLEVTGGRAVHPVNFKVGGFYSAPDIEEVKALIPRLEWGMDAARKIAIEFAKFDFPLLEQDYHCVSLDNGDIYPITRGRIVSNRGVNIDVTEFEANFGEEHVAHTNALQGYWKQGEKAYLTGPIARFNNKYDALSAGAKALAEECGLKPPINNPYYSILVRMVESYYACEEALRIAKEYKGLERASVEFTPRAASGFGATEAPRGVCFHHYDVGDDGRITFANIVPPTAQNQKQIEDDLLKVVSANLDMDDEALKWRCEQTIRNYDPCISCATHFLKFEIERT